jgi:hypothetical protein
VQKAVTITPTQIACSSCNLSEFCLPSEFSPEELHQLETLASTKRAYRRGSYLYRNGSKFGSLYAIRTGFFKTQVLHEDGREQVTGFQMAGEIIGLDAISTDVHTCDAVALEDSEICELPFNRLEELSRQLPTSFAQDHESRDRARPGYYAVAWLDACRRTPRGFSAQSVPTLFRTGLFRVRIQVAYDTARNRQLFGIKAGNRQPHTVIFSGNTFD